MNKFHWAIRSRVISGLAAAALWILSAGAPAHALDPGCTCPVGIPVGSSSCLVNRVTVPAVCAGPKGAALNNSISHLAASSQQLSFEGIGTILEGRRDQLQGTLGMGRQHPMISGYARSELDQQADQDFDTLGYAAASKRSNPLAAMAYKAAPAPVSSGPSFASWVQGLGDWERDQAASADDVSHFAATYAAQGGVDGTWRNVGKAGDALVVGLVGSYTHAHVAYDGTPTTTKLNGPGVGLYGTYLIGGFSTDLIGKFDFLGLDEDFAGIVPSNTLNLINAGASGNLQYKMELSGSAFVEPTAGFSFTRTMFGAGAATLGLTDASTLRLQAGSRFGTSWTTNGTSIEPSLKALLYSNVIAEGSANSALAGIVPTDQGKIRGEFTPNLDLDFGDGASATLSTSVRFGQGMIGGAASVNLRRQW